jgi:hypothetical protein
VGQRQRVGEALPTWRDRLAGAGAAIGAATTTFAVLLVVSFVIRARGLPEAWAWGDVIIMSSVAALLSAGFVLTVGVALSVVIDSLVGARSLRWIIAIYALTGVMGGATLAILFGAGEFVLVFPSMGLAAGAAGAFASYRRGRPRTAGAALGWVILVVSLPVGLEAIGWPLPPTAISAPVVGLILLGFALISVAVVAGHEHHAPSVGILDRRDDRLDDLPQVVRRDVGRHTDSDAGGAVDEEVGEPAGEDERLLLLAVVVVDEVDGVLVDVAEQLHRELGQPCLGVAHGGR